MTDLNQYYQLSEYIAAYIADEKKNMPEELKAWLAEHETHQAIFDAMVNEHRLKTLVTQYQQINVKAGWEQVSKAIKLNRSMPLWKKLASAAAALVIIGGGWLYYAASARHDEEKPMPGLAQHDITPGGNKAYLTLANGNRVSLTDAANGAVAEEAGVEITKTNNGQLVYQLSKSAPGGMSSSSANNTIETPRGGQYQVRLPDGTKVWLNAATKLIYPVSFNGQKQRIVSLTGEAYFEVAKDAAHPFHVKSAGQLVVVLGTHFNINSYPDEQTIKTTLLEGSVSVLTAISIEHPAKSALSVGNSAASPPYLKEGWSKTGVVLKPNQQSTLSNHEIKLTEVNPEEIIAWKNGDFLFKTQDFKTIMRMIARWYDVEIIFSPSAPADIPLGGKISRSKNISVLLKILEATGDVHFKIEGRKITVTN